MADEASEEEPERLAAAARFRGFSGWVPTGGGGDVATLPSGTSVADAQAACSASALCFGVTFEGPVDGPANSTVYLKNASACDDFYPYSPSHWSSWLKVLGPCDLVGGAPCVAAFSTVRALYGEYDGALYQLGRSADGATLDVGVAAGSPGVADAAAHDAFCAGSASCAITVLFDQSPQKNDLAVAPRDIPVNASQLPVNASGWRAYGMLFGPKNGYRNVRNTTGVALGNDPEVIYAVIDGRRANEACCFDFGNAEARPGDAGDGTMESLYYGTNSFGSHGFSSGPWVGADLENGIYYGTAAANPGNVPLAYPFILAMLKGRTDGFALKAGDATQAKLMTMWDGPRPSARYQPMQKQGGLILGIGGDNSNGAIGSFFEGIVLSGLTTDAQDDALHRNVVSAGYGQ